MKKILKKVCSDTIIFLSLIFIISKPSFGQVTPDNPTNLVQQFTAHIDKLGNADVEISQKMTASQWEAFRQSQIFNDPSIAKRDMEREMSTYVIEDFKRDIDDMNRTVKLSLKVLSYAQYKGNGHWTLKIESQDPQVTQLSDKAYMISGNTIMGNQLVQQILKVYFPSNADDVKQTTDEFGKAIFTYDAGTGLLSFVKWNNIVGIILIIFGLLFLIKQWLPFQNQNIKTSNA